MKRKTFRAEVGILLYPNDKEFDFYSNVYDKQYGYYDTNCGYFFSLSKAKEFIKSEKNCDYGIVTSDIINLTDEQIRAIKNQDYADEWYAWDANDIVYKEIRSNKKEVI